MPHRQLLHILIGGELKSEGVLVHVILNAYWEPLDFELPISSDGRQTWRRWIDTALDPPNDICGWNSETPVPGTTYRAGPRSVVVLIAATAPTAGVPAERPSTPTEVTPAVNSGIQLGHSVGSSRDNGGRS